jgi:hypothetical protein
MVRNRRTDPTGDGKIHRLVLPADYERRVAEAKRRVDGLGLRYAWLAEQVDCSPGWVSQVLGRHRAGEPVLDAIEALLDGVEAGDVDVPEAAYRRRVRQTRARVEASGGTG